jgi:acyl-CoA thioester hydrolase
MAGGPIEILVGADDLDARGHVNNAVYLRWIERAIHGHWQAGATADEFAAFGWVFVRHEIDYRKPARNGERLIVATRLTEVRRARAWYRTEIHRDADLLVETLSCCGCIDAQTGALTVIPRATAQRFLSG